MWQVYKVHVRSDSFEFEISSFFAGTIADSLGGESRTTTTKCDIKLTKTWTLFQFVQSKNDGKHHASWRNTHRKKMNALNIWKPFGHVSLALISLLFILNFFILIPCHSIVFLFPHISFITICYANEVIHRR